MPFIICNAIGQWKASTEWTIEKLTERFPNNIKHRITHNLDIMSCNSTMKMSFADYFQYAKNQHDETPLYIFDAHFGEKMPTMLEDYNVDDLKVFKEDFLSILDNPERDENNMTMPSKRVKLESGGKKVRKDKKKKCVPGSVRPDFRWIVIGPQRSGAPWHQDPARTSAWNSLVKGRKRWAIYPPNSPPPGVNVKSGEYLDNGLSMPSLMWYLHVYPTLTPDQKPLEIIQEEGETIYVPNGWWHLVLNLDLTIAVTQNFVDSDSVLMFMKDLLNDEQIEALTVLQYELQATRPETFDMFRLVQIPRVNGFLNEEMYQQSFRILEYWKPQVKRILKRHKMLAQPKTTGAAATNVVERVKYPTIKNLTSRMNPTISVGKHLLVKFYSQYNENWGEFDFKAYMTPRYDSADNDIASPSKRRKHNILKPYELKTAMSLRYAMEDCFRIEKSVYQMIATATDSTLSNQSLRAMVSRLYHCGHLLHVDEVDDDEGEGPMWRWPYIVIDYKSSGVGLDLVTKKGGATRASWNRVAAWISRDFLPKLHSVPVDPAFRGVYGHSKAEWEWYIHYMIRQRKRVVSFHLIMSDIPAHLMKLLDSFFPDATIDAIVSQLLPVKPLEIKPVLLHGDLTDENILGVKVNRQTNHNAVMPNLENDYQTSDLSAFLKSIGCEKYIPLLVEQEELTFELLSLLDEAHLKDLGIPLGPRLAILDRKHSTTSHARIVDSEDDGSDCRFDTEQEWETTSSSSNSSCESEKERDFTTPLGLAAIEAKRKEKFVGPQEWVPTSVIDFADAKTGDPLYDLVAVFFSALHCDRELWKMTLASEYWQQYIRREKMSCTRQRRCLGERFLQLVLLHPSHSVKGLFHYFPQAASFTNWEDLACGLFNDLF